MEAPTPEDDGARLDVVADLARLVSADTAGSLGGSLAAVPHGSFLMGCFTSASALEVAVTGRLPASTQGGEATDVVSRSRDRWQPHRHGLANTDRLLEGPGVGALGTQQRVTPCSASKVRAGV